MKRIKSVNTKAEVMLRKALWTLGYRYRKNPSEYPGKPDVFFKAAKVAVFIDGEFWHGYQWSNKKKKIKSNRDYWIKKIERNIARDKDNNKKLSDMGFTVIRFWEREIFSDCDHCVDIITQAIKESLL